MSIFGPPPPIVSRLPNPQAKRPAPVTYTITVPEPGGRISWTVEVTPDVTDGVYEGPKYDRKNAQWCVSVVDCATFAHGVKTGIVGSPDSDVLAREMGDSVYREFKDEIDALVRSRVEKSMEYVA